MFCGTQEGVRGDEHAGSVRFGVFTGSIVLLELRGIWTYPDYLVYMFRLGFEEFSWDYFYLPGAGWFFIHYVSCLHNVYYFVYRHILVIRCIYFVSDLRRCRGVTPVCEGLVQLFIHYVWYRRT